MRRRHGGVAWGRLKIAGFALTFHEQSCDFLAQAVQTGHAGVTNGKVLCGSSSVMPGLDGTQAQDWGFFCLNEGDRLPHCCASDALVTPGLGDGLCSGGTDCVLSRENKQWADVSVLEAADDQYKGWSLRIDH